MLRNQFLEHERAVEQRDEEIANLTGDIEK